MIWKIKENPEDENQVFEASPQQVSFAWCLAQFFLSGHSCLKNLLSTLSTVTQLMYDGGDIDMGFLDFSKEFDAVKLRFISPKVVALGVPLLVVGWILELPG